MRRSHLTLAKLLRRLLTDRTIVPERRAVLRQRALKVCAHAGVPPEMVRIDGVELRRIHKRIEFLVARFGRRHWKAYLQDMSFWLSYSGAGEGLRVRRSMTDTREAALVRAAGRYERLILPRFFAWCAREGVDLDEVDERALGRYREYLLHCTMVACPSRTIYGLKRCLGRDCKGSRGNPHGRGRKTCRTKVRGLDAYQLMLTGRLPLPSGMSISRPLKRSSARQAAFMLSAAANALPSKPREISLDELTSEPNVSALLSKLLVAGRSITYVYALYWALARARRLWSGRPIESTWPSKRRLRERISKEQERPARIGAIARDAELMAALYRLPHTLLEMANDEEITLRYRHSFAQIAAALEIVLQAPLWPGMLADLKIGDIARAAASNGVTLVDPFGRHYQFALPAASYEIVDAYLSIFRKVTGASARPNDFLFVNFRSAPCITAHLNRKIKHWGFKLLGVSLTLREYRYFAGLVYLQRHPGELETVRQLLGVRRLEWLKRAFQADSRQAAVEAYDRLLVAVR